MQKAGEASGPSRQTIAVTKAHALMLHEFAQHQPAGCRRCRVPMPFWGPAPGHEAGYWYQPAPAPCRKGCDKLLVAMWARVTTEYAIAPREKAPAIAGGGRRTAPSQR